MTRQPRLSVVPGELPNPPYPPDTKANGFRPEFDIRRIKQSKTWLLAAPDVRPWLLMIWLEAWESTPVGTYENDDEIIAARIGCRLEWFQVHREELMRGWVLHNDGRLYHGFLAGMIDEMLKRRRGTAERVKRHREKANVTACNALPRVTYAEEQETGDRKQEIPRSKPDTHERGSGGEAQKPPQGAKRPPRAKFTKPTIDDVTAYCTERRNSVDPHAFIDHYEANGWRVGKNAMRDWKAAVRTWERNNYGGNGNAASKQAGRKSAAERGEDFGRECWGRINGDIVD